MKYVVSAIFFLAAFVICGAVIGLTLELVLSEGAGHGLGDLCAIIIGVPTGALIGFVVALFISIQGLAVKRRLQLGGMALIMVALISGSIYLLVQTGVMNW